MFHRRLLLLLALFCCASGVLGAQLYRLTIIQGEELRDEAERILSSRRLVDTVRGRIFDAKDRVLAEDTPCYDIKVEYPVITGQSAYQKARQNAYRDNREIWGELSFDEIESLIADYREPYDRELENLWDTLAEVGGVTREELEARKAEIIQKVQVIRAEVWDRRLRQREAQVGTKVALHEVAIPVAEERESHTILPAVTAEAAYRIRELGEKLPGVKVEPSKARTYASQEITVELDRSTLPGPLRQEGAVSRIAVRDVVGYLVGGTRPVWEEDVDPKQGGRPFRRADGSVDLGGYLPGDVVGSSGVEATAEALLRGRRGQVVFRRDTSQEQRLPAVPGRDVHLTIDMALQARILAILNPEFGLTVVQDWHRNADTPVGTPLYGAAVVLDVDSGEILAMASTPTPDPGATAEQLAIDPNQPLYSKAFARAYPPGSTVKPLVYAIAAAQKHVGIDQPIECTGHFLDHRKDVFRCWIYREEYGYQTHGSLSPSEAIARSCNIYFHMCGHNLGAERLIAGLRQWGFDQPTGLSLPLESSGILPSLTGPNVQGRELSVSNALMMGIGQGPFDATPLQVAAAHAALARGGYYIGPTLIREMAEDRAERDLQLPPRVVDVALRGMYESANSMEYGTGAYINLLQGGKEPIFNIKDVTVRGKTGTAQAADQFELVLDGDRVVPNRDKRLRSGDHSWYVAHVQKEGRKRAGYVVVVLIEYGGSGGRVSGPVTNQILHAMRAEGYL